MTSIAHGRLHAGRLEHAPAHDAELRRRRFRRRIGRSSPTYLIKNFPERPRPAAVDHRRPGAGGDQRCGTCRRSARGRTIRSRPRTARSGGPGNSPTSSAGVDPKTGAIREYTLKTPHTGPHGLVEDKDGNIWFTGNHAGADRQARSEDRRRHRVQDARPEGEGSAHADLRSRRHPMVHRAAGEHGRPARSEDRRDQTRHARRHRGRAPTECTVNSKDVVRCSCEFGTNKIATIDPQDDGRSRNTRCRIRARGHAASRSRRDDMV